MNSPIGAVERQFRKTWVCFLIERFSGTRSHFLSSLDDDKAPVSCSPNGCTCMSTAILKLVGLSFIFISTLACEIKESICSKKDDCFVTSVGDQKPNVNNQFMFYFLTVLIWKEMKQSCWISFRIATPYNKQINWLFTFGCWSATDVTKQTKVSIDFIDYIKILEREGLWRWNLIFILLVETPESR